MCADVDFGAFIVLTVNIESLNHHLLAACISGMVFLSKRNELQQSCSRNCVLSSKIIIMAEFIERLSSG